MHQLTLRVPDELAAQLKLAAHGRDESVNGYAVMVLSAAVDPELAGDEVTGLKERLARAGLLLAPARLLEGSPLRTGAQPCPRGRRRAWQATVGLRRRGSPLSTFVDSSALVKLYADEPGHREIRALAVLVVSALARVEVPSAPSCDGPPVARAFYCCRRASDERTRTPPPPCEIRETGGLNGRRAFSGSGS